MNTRTKKRFTTRQLVSIALLSAMAYLVMFFGRIPVVLFLKYDPKDVIIAIGGLLYGPMAAFLMSVVVSFFEMLTVSDTGPIGLVMNILSSCAFACTASFIYKKLHNMKGAVVGLVAGLLAATAAMMLWNYYVVPIYMGIPRQAVAELLIPAFLPFNLLKGTLNAALTLLLYKPLSRALKKTGTLPASLPAEKNKSNTGVLLLSAFVVASCIMLILVWTGIV